VSFAARSGLRAKRARGEEKTRELKQLRDENTKLKRLVADPSLDKVMLQDVVQNTF